MKWMLVLTVWFIAGIAENEYEDEKEDEEEEEEEEELRKTNKQTIAVWRAREIEIEK